MAQVIRTLSLTTAAGNFTFDGWHLGHIYRGKAYPNWDYYLLHDSSIYRVREDKLVSVLSEKCSANALEFDPEKKVIIDCKTRNRWSVNV